MHTTQELSVLLVTDTVIHSLEITKKPKVLKTAYILNLKTLACRARNIIRGIHASLSSACATNFPAVPYGVDLASAEAEIRHVFGFTSITEASIEAAAPGNNIAQCIILGWKLGVGRSSHVFNILSNMDH